MPPRFYGVRIGRGGPAIFTSWPDARAAVHGFPRAVFKGFGSRGEAAAFIRGGGSTASGGGSGVPQAAPGGRGPAPPWESGDGEEGGGAEAGAAATEEAPPKKKRQRSTKAAPAAAGGEAGAVGAPHPAPTSLLHPLATYRLEFDGASRGNHVPGGGGDGGCGAVLYLEGEPGAPPAPGAPSASLTEVGRLCVPIGAATNNVAEWRALEMGMEVRRMEVKADGGRDGEEKRRQRDGGWMGWFLFLSLSLSLSLSLTHMQFMTYTTSSLTLTSWVKGVIATATDEHPVRTVSWIVLAVVVNMM